MNNLLISFIEKQNCASICTVNDLSKPYCFTCFYAFNADKGYLYFKSSDTTKHAKILTIHPYVSGTILPDKLNKMHTQGIQFEGVAINPDNTEYSDAKSYYYYKHPEAIAIQGFLYIIRIDHIKMSERIAGVARKNNWDRQTETLERNL